MSLRNHNLKKPTKFFYVFLHQIYLSTCHQLAQCTLHPSISQNKNCGETKFQTANGNSNDAIRNKTAYANVKHEGQYSLNPVF